MSRAALKKLPDPSPVQPMRVVGLGASRTGTIGLFLSLKVLGYKPFHISELLPHGVPQMKALEEAMLASSTDQPFTRAELDKLFGDYDCLIESPCYLGRSGIESYLSDPSIKFILTQRSPTSFAKSLSGSLGHYYARLQTFPFSLTRLIDPFVYELERMFGLMTHRWSLGLHPSHPDFQKNLAASYEEWQKLVYEMVPPERMLVLDLDKGFGWDDICAFLGCERPEEEYPRANTMAEFHVAAEMVLAPAVRKTYAMLGTVAAVGVAVGGWFARRKWR